MAITCLCISLLLLPLLTRNKSLKSLTKKLIKLSSIKTKVKNMSHAFFSSCHVIIPASSAIGLHPPPSNIHLFPSTNHPRKLRLRSRPTPIKNNTNSSFDLKDETGMGRFHEVEFNVRDYELDMFGVVNNAIFASYCQQARHQLLRKIGINVGTIAQTGDAIAISESSLKYIAPLRFGDRFIVKVRVSDISAARVYFEHFILKLPNEEPVLEARATVVWLDKSYRPIRIPPDVRSKILQFIHHEVPN